MTAAPNGPPPLPPTSKLTDAARPAVEPLLWNFAVACDRLGVPRRTLERLRAAGRFPKPDLHIGKRPMWRPETIRDWVERGGRQ
jgi:predicted DNA-binding transcriptional regulator AlpA